MYLLIYMYLIFMLFLQFLCTYNAYRATKLKKNYIRFSICSCYCQICLKYLLPLFFFPLSFSVVRPLLPAVSLLDSFHVLLFQCWP